MKFYPVLTALLVGMMWTVFWVGDAKAQPSERFPQSTTIVQNGIRYEAFDLGGYTQLLRMDTELTGALFDIELLEQQLLQYQEQVAQLRIIIGSLEEDVAILQTERTRLLQRWTEENRLRLECENAPNITEGLAWGLSAALAVATVVLAVVVGTGE